MNRLMLALALACAAVPAAAEPPPKPATSTDADKCEWIWKEGGGLGVWTETCRMNGVWEAVYDDKAGAFVITIDGEPNGVVLQRFVKPADADIAAILPELRKRGLIPDDDECVFAKADRETSSPDIAFYEIMPVGSRKAAFDATPADEVPEPPCGDFGFAPDGISYFMTDSRHPDAVVYFNLGQDGMMFDPGTVTIE